MVCDEARRAYCAFREREIPGREMGYRIDSE